MAQFTIKYYAGPYAGIETVKAADSQEAINKVRGKIRRSMTLPLYSDGYEVIAVEPEENNFS